MGKHADRCTRERTPHFVRCLMAQDDDLRVATQGACCGTSQLAVPDCTDQRYGIMHGQPGVGKDNRRQQKVQVAEHRPGDDRGTSGRPALPGTSDHQGFDVPAHPAVARLMAHRWFLELEDQRVLQRFPQDADEFRTVVEKCTTERVDHQCAPRQRVILSVRPRTIPFTTSMTGRKDLLRTTRGSAILKATNGSSTRRRDSPLRRCRSARFRPKYNMGVPFELWRTLASGTQTTSKPARAIRRWRSTSSTYMKKTSLTRSSDSSCAL